MALLPEWLKRRPDETEHDWRVRQQRSCYFCPHPAFDDGKEADEHEIECGKRTPERRRALLGNEIREKR